MICGVADRLCPTAPIALQAFAAKWGRRMIELLLSIAHFLAVFAMVAILATEIALIRPGITAEDVVRVRRLDGYFGSLIGLVLLVGVLLVSYGERGQEFYMSNPVFWMKMAAFAAVGLLSVQPTIRIYYWWQQARGGGFFSAPPDEIARVRRFLRMEAFAFGLIPIFSVAVARGIDL
jgi:putative membrane protein